MQRIKHLLFKKGNIDAFLFLASKFRIDWSEHKRLRRLLKMNISENTRDQVGPAWFYHASELFPGLHRRFANKAILDKFFHKNRKYSL